MAKVLRVTNPGVVPGATLDLGLDDEGVRFITRQGPPGASGAGVVSVPYRFSVPSATWTIEHNKNGKPAITLFLDSDPNEPVYTDVGYPDDSTIIVEWASPVTGYAYL